VRIIAGIMANVLLNELTCLVRARVVYDREIFNFEEYHTKGLTDQRLLSDILFLGVKRPGKDARSGKFLMSEFYKFQNQDLLNPLMTPNSIVHFLTHLVLHIRKLDEVSKAIDIEPLFIAYYSDLSDFTVSKDALSKVTKNFFKEFKMDYRRYSESNSFVKILSTMHYFFEGHKSETVRSFFQFMIAITCERLGDEHCQFVFTIVRERTFTDKNMLQKFQVELRTFNAFMTVLFHLDYPYSRFPAFRSLRDIQHRVKRFCEVSDRRIERQLSRNIMNDRLPDDLMKEL